jgi:hypothetical protein
MTVDFKTEETARQRVERLVPSPPEDLWNALIEHAELDEQGAMLHLGSFAARITVYESRKVLECTRGTDTLRWELHPSGKMTRVVLTADVSRDVEEVLVLGRPRPESTLVDLEGADFRFERRTWDP